MYATQPHNSLVLSSLSLSAPSPPLPLLLSLSSPPCSPGPGCVAGVVSSCRGLSAWRRRARWRWRGFSSPAWPFFQSLCRCVGEKNSKVRSVNRRNTQAVNYTATFLTDSLNGKDTAMSYITSLCRLQYGKSFSVLQAMKSWMRAWGQGYITLVCISYHQQPTHRRSLK